MAQQTDSDLDVFNGIRVGTALVEPVALCDFCNRELEKGDDVHALVYHDEAMVSWVVCDDHSESLTTDGHEVEDRESYGQWVTATLDRSLTDPLNLRLNSVRALDVE
jgi:hypothetical protein